MNQEKRDRIPSNLREQIAVLPHSPGVYLFEDRHSKVLYVGKAKDLKKRASSYLRDDQAIKTRLLMDRARDISFIVTATEKEALLLENTLIKKHRPRYNVDLRDDKSYPCLRLSINEPFPRLEIMRRPKNDGALYFGPFSSAGAVRQTLKLMQRLFPLRKCKGKIGESKRPCLNYQMGRCLGPCWGNVTEDEYNKVVQEAVYFLQGKRKELQQMLRREMEEAAASLDFERAAVLRDRYKAVSATLEKQNVVDPALRDADILGVSRGEEDLELAVLSLRGGSLVGSRSFTFDPTAVHTDDFVSEFIKRYYDQSQFIPPEILLPETVTDRELLEEWLSEERGGRVRIFVPQRGEKRNLVKLAHKNAENFRKVRLSKETQALEILEEIQKGLHLNKLPRFIECYDISTTMGKQNVGSKVSFYMGQPNKMGYRRYKVEGQGHPDDYAMMREVLSRRIAHVDEEPMPDLLMVDGGKGQLNMALSVASEHGLEQEMAGLAKEGFDKVFLPGRKNPVIFRPDSKALHMLQRIRDESHRFAIQYHRKLRSKAGLDTVLNAIPGVGSRRRQTLLARFGSVERLRLATVEEIAGTSGVSRNLAQSIYDHLREPDAKPTD